MSIRHLSLALVIGVAGISSHASAADLTGDGVVDLADVEVMKSAFFSHDPHADLNRDGVVEFADLALLRAAFSGGPPAIEAATPHTRANRGGDLTVFTLPTARNVLPGGIVIYNINMDFRNEPTLGGGIDLVYDPTLLQLVDFTYETNNVGDDPAFRNPPTFTAGAIQGITVGSFFGLTGPGTIGTAAFQTLAIGASDISPTASAFNWVSLISNIIQTPLYSDSRARTAATIAPDIELSPASASIEYGNIPPGATPTVDLTIRNVGPAALVLGDIAQANPLLGEFSIDADNCSGQSLALLDTCTVAITAAPTELGTIADTFDVPSNDPSEPSLTISVAANAVTLSPAPRITSVGTSPVVGVCANSVSGQNFTVPLDGAGSLPLNCRGEGLDIASGDSLVLSLVGIATSIGVGGAATFVDITTVQCLNGTNGQQQFVVPTGQAWSCIHPGLEISPGDRIIMILQGVAQ